MLVVADSGGVELPESKSEAPGESGFRRGRFSHQTMIGPGNATCFE